MDNTNWGELEHAYGKATDIPDLLSELESYPTCNECDDEPFYTLWSSLCHQGDVYSASYAALPKIVSIIEIAPEKVSYNYFLLPVCIEIARLKGKGPKISKSIEVSYFSAIQTLANLTGKANPEDETMVPVLAAVTAVRYGKAELADAILELNTETLAEFQEWLFER